MKQPRIHPVHGLRTNARDLVMISVAGQVASPTERGTPWRIGYDGRPRSLPGTGGIVLNHRVGDPCVGLAGDHVEPAVSIRNEARAAGGNPDAANQALQSYSCVGNHAIVTSGRAVGARGVVTGKHGGVDTVLIDFPLPAMRQMAIGDRIQVWAYGLGLRLTDYPDVAIWNCSPRLLARWRPVERNGRIHVKGTPAKGLAWKDACKLIGTEPISVDGEWGDGLSSTGTSGVQFSEVDVDIETGIVKVKRILTVQDCGLVVDKLLAESQIYGGIVGSLNFAMFEDRILDRNTGQMVNPNMEMYLLAGMSDIPKIDIMLMNQPERGVIGIGEPPTVSTASAIATAVRNATGATIRSLPLHPHRVLQAIEQEKAGGTL